MPHPSIIKQQFLKKWLVGLQACSSLKRNMDLLERKKVIKLSADLAMASARNGATCWSRAIIAKSVRDDTNQVLVKHVLDRAVCERLKKHSSGTLRGKKIMSQKINRRVCHRARKSSFARSKVLASSIAKRLVQKRTKVLRSLVPGGEFIEDEVSLIEETLDYLSFLQAQVDVMRCLASCK